MSSIINYNPDILTCLANLSNDEIFTPPEVANAVLDMIPSEFWSDPNVKVLDPAVKSGVFLREAAKRFIKGLEDKIPDRQKRIDHIMHNQLYGMAITELTGHMARRTVYCSKRANGPYSVSMFEGEEQGNILYYPCKHTWKGNKCSLCGASEEVYNRGEELESHAYEFIHLTDKQLKDYNMKFDLIIGNPPYQLEDGGGNGASAMPIYHHFVLQAKKLKPRYMTMIIPARWYSGGKGLDDFRDEMLHDDCIRILHDYPDASKVFPGVQIKSGVCFFLWNRDNRGNCKVFNHLENSDSSSIIRPLLEKDCETFIRYNSAIEILDKVRLSNFNSIMSIVSYRMPFGLANIFKGHKTKQNEDDLEIFVSGNESENKGKKNYVQNIEVKKGRDLIDVHKVFIGKAGSGSDSFPHLILTKPFYGGPNTVCNESYLVIGPFDDKQTCLNVISYISTKFFRFMVLLKKSTQNATRNVYQFVPIQDFSKPWTDEELYKKYGLTEDEINFIESMIKPMDLEG